MNVSLTGLLSKAAQSCRDRNGGEDFALRQLHDHLRELYDRREEGQKVLDEFFAVYVFQGERLLEEAETWE